MQKYASIGTYLTKKRVFFTPKALQNGVPSSCFIFVWEDRICTTASSVVAIQNSTRHTQSSPACLLTYARAAADVVTSSLSRFTALKIKNSNPGLVLTHTFTIHLEVDMPWLTIPLICAAAECWRIELMSGKKQKSKP